MAEEAAPQHSENNPEITTSVNEDMDLENLEAGAEPKELTGGSDANEAALVTNGDANSKREREEEIPDQNNGVPKKQKVETSVEEQRLEKVEGEGEGEGEGKGEGKGEEGTAPVSLGPKSFGSSVEMFDYFYKLLHYWPPNLNVNKYEQMVLMELLKKGHAEADKKMGSGVCAFQIRFHPMWKSKCFFLIREDESVDDFSFRKCVDQILPLPENMKVKSDSNRGAGGGGGGGKHRGGRGGGGRGRGGRFRN